MNVFISWSGPTSRQVAEALRDWLPLVIQAVKPWLSSLDVEKGARWFPEISEQLKDTDVGIICLTADNMGAPWVHFEAGAVSKVVERSRVCPYLFGIGPTDIQGPLAQFQATRAEKDDTKNLLATVNKALGERALTSQRLDEAFEVWWPKLQEKLEHVTPAHEAAGADRPDRELLQEVLETVRQLARRAPEAGPAFPARRSSPTMYAATYDPGLSGAASDAASEILGGGPTLRRLLLEIARREARKQAMAGASDEGTREEDREKAGGQGESEEP